jgi:hypothetical protein
MKKTYLILFTSLIAGASFGQSFQKTVFNSTGGYIGAAGSQQLMISVGEPITGMSTSQTSKLSLAQGFIAGSKSVVATTEGINEVTADYATIYPNPFTNNVRINSDIENIHVSVYNTMGQEVYNGVYPAGGLDLSPLTPGMYIVRATANNQIISNTKLLKQ